MYIVVVLYTFCLCFKWTKAKSSSCNSPMLMICLTWSSENCCDAYSCHVRKRNTDQYHVVASIWWFEKTMIRDFVNEWYEIFLGDTQEARITWAHSKPQSQWKVCYYNKIFSQYFTFTFPFSDDWIEGAARVPHPASCGEFMSGCL